MFKKPIIWVVIVLVVVCGYLLFEKFNNIDKLTNLKLQKTMDSMSVVLTYSDIKVNELKSEIITLQESLDKRGKQRASNQQQDKKEDEKLKNMDFNKSLSYSDSVLRAEGYK